VTFIALSIVMKMFVWMPTPPVIWQLVGNIYSSCNIFHSLCLNTQTTRLVLIWKKRRLCVIVQIGWIKVCFWRSNLWVSN
jgi:hypothetical protein